MQNRTDRIEADSQKYFSAYVSVPERPNGHAVVVVQEIFGVTPHIREVADRYAEAGYLALAPDLFWRIEPGLSLTHSKEDMQRAFAVLAEFDERLGVEDIDRVASYARTQPGIHSVAVVGMCLGGKLAYLAASRLNIAAAIAFYGVGIEKNLDEAQAVKVPLLMFFGGKDRYAAPAVRGQIEAATSGNSKVQIQVYEDADHGFYTRGEAVVRDVAHAQALAFLQKNLPVAGLAA